MRFGCVGCLFGVLFVALGGTLILGVTRCLERPERVAVVGDPGDAARAQQKLAEVLGGVGRRGSHAVVLTEREVNALLASRLGGLANLPLADVAVSLQADHAIGITARLSLADLVGTAIRGPLPVFIGGHAIWLDVQARPTVDPAGTVPRYLRFTPTRLAVGRQRLPVIALRLLLRPETLAVFAWRLPTRIQDVVVERGYLVVQTARTARRPA